MPTPKKGYRLGGSSSHQKAILNNLATSLFEHGRITTTEAKARMLRPFAERLITKAKKGDLHNRRIVLRAVRDKGVVHTLFTEIGPQFADRPGGYTRITKLGPRKGDNAPMAVIELVTEPYAPKASSGATTSTTSSTPAAAPAADEAPESTEVPESTEDDTAETTDGTAEDTTDGTAEDTAPPETVAEDALAGTAVEESAADPADEADASSEDDAKA